MSRLFTRFQAPTLQNTGSTARDHLASERTFLAWLRTGLGFIALGIGVERFSRLEVQSSHLAIISAQQQHQLHNATLEPAQLEPGQHVAEVVVGKKIGVKPPVKASQRSAKQQKEKRQEELLVAALLGTGTASILYGAGRYFSNFRLMQMGLFKPSSLGAGLLAITVSGLAGGAWMGVATDEHDHPDDNPAKARRKRRKDADS